MGQRNTIEFDRDNHRIIFAIERGDEQALVTEAIGDGKAIFGLPANLSVSWLINSTNVALARLKETGVWKMKTPAGFYFDFSYSDVQLINEFALKNK